MLSLINWTPSFGLWRHYHPRSADISSFLLKNMGLCQVWPWDIYPHTSLCLSKSSCFMVFDKSFIGFLLWSSFKPWVLRLFMAWIRWSNVTVINPGDWTQLAPQTIIRAFAENEIKLVNGQKAFLNPSAMCKSSRFQRCEQTSSIRMVQSSSEGWWRNFNEAQGAHMLHSMADRKG